MAKKRWDRSKYPDNWEELSRMFRASKDFTCEHCGTRQGTLRISKAWNVYPSRVVAAHRYPNDTQNPHPELLCLCERCHFPYDGRFRGIIEEGEHEAVLHGVLVERYLEHEEEVRPMRNEGDLSMWDEQAESEEDQERAAYEEELFAAHVRPDAFDGLTARLYSAVASNGHPDVCLCPSCAPWEYEAEDQESEEEIGTYFRCAAHPETYVSVRRNSYYCPVCRCTPEYVLGPWD